MDAEVQPSAIAISGFGAITSAGANATQSFAAFQAGIVAISEHAYISCTPEEPGWDMPLPLYAAHVPTLDPEEQSIERFIQLAIPALEEALEHANLCRSDLATTGILVAAPTLNTGITDLNLQQDIIKQLCSRMGLTSLNSGHAFCSGHTAAVEAIHHATRALQQNKLEHVLILAVDTYLLEGRISHYDKNWRIKSERNVDGFIPGEASCVLVLELASTARNRESEIHGVISGCGFGQETNIISGDKSSTGEGLRQAISGALANIMHTGFTHFYSDFNGESYYAYETGLLQPRFPEVFSTLEKSLYPVTCFGETGAVNSTLSIMLACRGAQGEKTRSLITCCNDDGKRAALVLTTE